MERPEASVGDLRTTRRRLRLTQREFGELLGVTARKVSRWENGHIGIPREIVPFLEAKLRQWRREVGEFIAERLQQNPSAILPSSLVWRIYREWCQARSKHPLALGMFEGTLTGDYGFEHYAGDHGSWKGVALKGPREIPDIPQAPEPPPLGPGPDYAPVGGKLAAVPHAPSEDEAKLQARLHAQLRTKVAGLVAALAHAGNQYAELMRAAGEYEVLLQGPTNKLDIVRLWSVGGSLHELLGAYREQTAGTLAPPLEPQMIAALASVVRDHGAFVLGFEEGRDLVDRADRFTLQPELIDEVAESGAELLDELATNGELIEDETRNVHATIRDTLHVTGWRASRTTYAGYLTVRNAFRAIIRFSVGRDLNATVFAGGLIAASQLAGDPNCEFVRTAIPVLQQHAAQLLAFFKHSPEFRAYVQWALDALERDRIANGE